MIIKYFKYASLILTAVLYACSDDINKDRLGQIHEINFNEIQLDRFSFKIPDSPFTSGDSKSGVLTFNVVRNGDDIEGGFVLSNKNWRSYPWSLSEDWGAATATEATKRAALDSCRFSVWTNRGGTTQTYVVAKIKDDLAYFTLDAPNIIEHLLVGNTTYNYLLMTYGSYYSNQLNPITQIYEPYMFIGGTTEWDLTRPAKVANPMIPDNAAIGRWSLPTPDGEPMLGLTSLTNLKKLAAGNAAAQAAREQGKPGSEIYNDSTAAADAVGEGWFKIIIKGYLNGNETGKIDYYMGARTNAVADFPALNTIKNNWFAVELYALGTVDKVVFSMDSSDQDEFGRPRMPPYVCIDGIRLQNRVK